MAADASHALGAPEIAGAFVNPKGLAKRMTAAVAGGELAGVAGQLALGATARGASSETAKMGRVGYVAVTAEEVAVVRTKPARLGLKMQVADEVLARSPRTGVSAVEWDERHLVSHLRIRFADGGSWEFDVPKAGRQGAQAVVRALER